MAIGIQNFPNIIPSDSDYLSGRIKDDSGANDGTPIDQLTNGDIQEFFAKMMKLASITPNGIFDNEYSGHQYIQGLIQQIFNRGSSPIITGLIGSYTANDLIILYGSIALSNSNNTATWTDMAIYYNGNTYLVAAGTSTKSSGVFLFTISDSMSFMITITHGTSGTGIANYGATTVKTLQPIGLKTSWINFTLINGWTTFGATAAYRLDGTGKVQLRGFLQPDSATDVAFAAIPAGIAPATGNRIFKTISALSGGLVGDQGIGVDYQQIPTPSANKFSVQGITIGTTSGNISLDGVNYDIF